MSPLYLLTVTIKKTVQVRTQIPGIIVIAGMYTILCISWNWQAQIPVWIQVIACNTAKIERRKETSQIQEEIDFSLEIVTKKRLLKGHTMTTSLRMQMAAMCKCVVQATGKKEQYEVLTVWNLYLILIDTCHVKWNREQLEVQNCPQSCGWSFARNLNEEERNDPCKDVV